MNAIYFYTKRLQISRIVPKENRSLIGMDRMLIDINLDKILSNDQNIELFDGDTIEVFPIGELYENYVDIIGSSIIRPGRYQLIQGMRVSDLINSADGLLNNAFLDIAHIKRTNEHLSSELININLISILDGNKDEDIELKFLDQLIIYNKHELNNLDTYVSVYGAIKNPGIFPLQDKKSLGDLIIMSGAFNENIKKVKITIARSNSKSFNPKIYNFPNNNGFVTIKDLSNPKSNINSFLLFLASLSLLAFISLFIHSPFTISSSSIARISLSFLSSTLSNT